MTRDEFHNGLRLLHSIDRHEIEAKGYELTPEEWFAFCSNPYYTFIKAPDALRNAIWAAMIERML